MREYFPSVLHKHHKHTKQKQCLNDEEKSQQSIKARLSAGSVVRIFMLAEHRRNEDHAE